MLFFNVSNEPYATSEQSKIDELANVDYAREELSTFRSAGVVKEIALQTDLEGRTEEAIARPAQIQNGKMNVKYSHVGAGRKNDQTQGPRYKMLDCITLFEDLKFY